MSRRPAKDVQPPEPAATPTPPLTLLWLALIGIVLAGAPWLGGQWTGVGPACARALVCAAGLAWLADRRSEARLPRPAVWLWLFTAWSALTIIQGTSLHASLVALGDVISFAAILTLCTDAARISARRAFLVGAMLLGAAVVSVMGVLHAISSGAGWREFGSFVTPNIFACYLVTILPVAFLVAVRTLAKTADPEREPRTPLNLVVVMVGIVALAGGFTGLLMTGSKGAVGAFAISVAVVFVAARPWRLLRRPMVGLAVLMLVFAFGLGGRTLLGRVESAGGTEAHSSQFRLLTWKGAANMAVAHPLTGTGIGTFGAVFNQYAIAGWTQAAHNAYLQAADETGVPGLVLFLGTLVTAALALWKRARSGNLVAVGALAGLLAAAIHNGVDYGWSLWGPSAALWGLVGLGLSVGEGAKVRSWVSVLIGVALAAALAGNILLANSAATSEAALDHYNNLTPDERVAALRSARSLDPLDGLLPRELGVQLAQAGDQAGALVALHDAVRLTPNDPVAWRLLGEGLENQGRNQDARIAFSRGLELSPNSFKLLLDAARLSEQTTGGNGAALGYYRRLVAAAEGPVGKYPATPEIVDIEPLYAYAALAADADKRGDRAVADRYRRSLVALADRYDANRRKYALMWQATGKDNPADLEAVQRLRVEAQASLTGSSSAIYGAPPTGQ